MYDYDILSSFVFAGSLVVILLASCGSEAEKFRTNGGSFDLNTYKKNLAILECAVKGAKPGETCRGTEIGDFTMPSRYEGDASDVEVVTFQYPPGTEFAHPVYYLDPANTISFKITLCVSE